MATIIAKHTVGAKITHNKDGKFTRAWRLLDDGTVERTNSKSKYQRYLAGEKIPAALLAAAEKAGLTIQPGREEWRTLPRKPESSKRRPSVCIRLTDSEAERLRENAAAADKNLTDFIVARCCGDEE
jgi:hypothetical protein